MLEFFFGWLVKPEIQVTLLDKIVFWIELVICFVILIAILTLIETMKDKRKNKGGN